MENFWSKFYALPDLATLIQIGSLFFTGLLMGWIFKKSLKLLFWIVVLFTVGYLWLQLRLIESDTAIHGLYALPHMLQNLSTLLLQKLGALDFLAIGAIIVGFLLGLMLA